MAKHFTSIISSLFGKFASYSFPKPIQKVINGAYVKFMGLDMSEFEEPSNYKSLNALFTRELKSKREINKIPNIVISPCDSLITQIGVIEKKSALQIKGMSYSVEEFLGDFFAFEANKLEGGEYINFYLSPKDYHRYHMPIDVEVESIVHIPGKLYPVNIPFLKKKKNLFIENERVVIALRDIYKKRHFLVLVGALNVGGMVVTFEPKIETNSSITTPCYYRYDKPIKIKKGECFGYFKMGSTIVLLSEKNSIDYSIEAWQKVKFGQTIGKLI